MFVAASTECFASLPLVQAIERLDDLEFTSVEIALHEHGQQLKPSEVQADLARAVDLCRYTHRLDVVAYDVIQQAEGPEYYEQFRAICELAKKTKVVTITVPASPLGTPFNEEVDRLRALSAIAQLHGARISLKSQIGTLSEDPDTVVVLCNNVDGLGVTLDPSHYLCGPHGMRNMNKLYKFVYHVHLRDSTKDKLQVRVGQGEIEYGKLINNLRRVGYTRALSVNIREMEGVDQNGELRKTRLLLETLL
ncbi:MAG: hypothetical protein KatS3mg110_1475 [Pirellulaceae bacterium]|nr:MAG: hypothetical protein KatS3mg110_1475 [Pirellulaceae bacterium]